MSSKFIINLEGLWPYVETPAPIPKLSNVQPDQMSDHLARPSTVNMDGVMDNSLEVLIRGPSSNSSCVNYKHLHTNTLRNDMNPLLLSPVN